MKRFSLYGFCRWALWGISLLAVYAIFFLNFIYNSSVSYDGYERVSIDGFLLGGHWMLLMALVLVLALTFTKKYLEKINPYLLFLGFSVLYTGMAIYLILNVDVTIRADAATVFNTAGRFWEGDYGAFFKGGYIERYPQQTGLLFYDSLLRLLWDSPAVSFVANFLFVLGINFFTLRLSMLLSESRIAAILTLFLSFAFLPQFFFILFAYGLIPGFFFTVLAFYHAVAFTKRHKIRNAVASVISISVATCLKQNFLIAVIAIALYWLLDLFRAHGKALFKPLLALLALLLCFSLPSKLIISYYEQKTESDLSGGTPTVLWLVMGTDPENRYRAPGWYNGYNYSTYTSSGYDTEKAAELGNARLCENLEKMKADPEMALSFFKDKTVSQWCDPMFQSVWSGPLEGCQQFTHTKLLQSIYNGGEAEERIAALSKYLVILIFASVLAFLILRRKGVDGWEPFLMFFIGGLLFHTVWEGKSQYIYPYVFSLIPLASMGLISLSERMQSLLDRYFFHKKEYENEQE